VRVSVLFFFLLTSFSMTQRENYNRLQLVELSEFPAEERESSNYEKEFSSTLKEMKILTATRKRGTQTMLVIALKPSMIQSK